MIDEPSIKVAVEKRRLLSDFRRLRTLMAEYDRFLHDMDPDGEWQEQAIDLLRTHHASLNQAKVSLKTIDLIYTLLRELLQQVKLERFNFRLDGSSAGAGQAAGADDNGGAGRASFDELIAQVNGLAKNAPLAMQEKIRFLLVSILNLLRELADGNYDGAEEAITQINLLTSNRESQNLVREIAIIARDIYNSLNTLSDTLPVESLTESSEGISDAVSKLKAVINRLEEAAFQNLDALELLSSRLNEDRDHLARLSDALREAQNRLGELKAEFPALQGDLESVQDRLGDRVGSGVMTVQCQVDQDVDTYLLLTSNQSFQDLTGQTLKKIIDFIEQLELQLVKLLQKYKPVLELAQSETMTAAAPKAADGDASQGGGKRATQNEVDSLLADLGF